MQLHSSPHEARTIMFSRFGRDAIGLHLLRFRTGALRMSQDLNIASLALCLLAAGVVVTSPAALASQSQRNAVMTSPDGLRYQIVEFGDLRLGTAAGTQALHARIRRAARRVYGDSDPRLPLRQMADRLVSGPRSPMQWPRSVSGDGSPCVRGSPEKPSGSLLERSNMRFNRRIRILLGPLVLLASVYVARAIMVATDNRTISTIEGDRSGYQTIAIFGASGTAGDGILEAALADPDIETIQVITRRATPRIDQGVASGKVQMILHTDYTDYTAMRDRLADTDAVFWALGTSSLGVDEETYARIHVAFPMRFVEAWVDVSTKPDKSFHYVSSSDISEDSSSMWARQKVRAEKSLSAFADDRSLKVIAYRPDYIGPARDEAHIGQDLLFWIFRPVGAAVRAAEIGRAMIEVSARGADFKNGDKLGTASIIRYSDAYERLRRRRS